MKRVSKKQQPKEPPKSQLKKPTGLHSFDDDDDETSNPSPLVSI
jgi:hypothetical protein